MRIWFPANLAVHVDDPVLNSIVPSAQISSSGFCTTPPYQRTAVYATCDFTGGGTAITGVDVTSLVTFISPSSSSSIAIINNYIQARGSSPYAHCCITYVSPSSRSSCADVRRSFTQQTKQLAAQSCILSAVWFFAWVLAGLAAGMLLQAVGLCAWFAALLLLLEFQV